MSHIFLIIFTLVRETKLSKMAGIFHNLLDFEERNLIAFCISCYCDWENVANKNQKRTFSRYIKIYLSNIFNCKMYIEDKSLDVFCHDIKFKTEKGVWGLFMCAVWVAHKLWMIRLEIIWRKLIYKLNHFAWERSFEERFINQNNQRKMTIDAFTRSLLTL